MGRSRYKIYENNQVHFLTCTIINWIPLFTRSATVQILFDSLNYLQQQERLTIYGYVVLENHIHLIAQADNLNKEIMCFKSYTAKMLIRYLKEQKVTKILKQLAYYKLKFKTDRQHQVWQEGSHPQLLQNEDMLRQKLDYIHQNPVQRGYIDDPVHWRYSSARNYARIEGVLPIFTGW